MIDFLKLIISNLKETVKNTEGQDEVNDISKTRIIIYIAILICALIFVSLLIYVIVKCFPSFKSSFENSYENTKHIITDLK